ncbi:hypothetical protein EDD16DRAFT_773211 [Pisolithus croceorrhizus]|nr:hypothetical protein EDD16DRAFT_773211 [Pisolithus croceorrhizus]KAI6096555.1 hypothetical protein EV401DRAFT_2083019 [Pisolithus croceorrhizus]KAI6156418.1 hypothetical protein EDD17DRAFT_1050317 [Pisolithus thermaeus]
MSASLIPYKDDPHDKKPLLKKLPRFLRRFLCALGMAPEPPKIKGVFTKYDVTTPYSLTIRQWYEDLILDDPATLECALISVTWYKNKNGVRREFLRLDFSSPDKLHTSIVVAERGTSDIKNGNPSNIIQPSTDIEAVTPLGAATPLLVSQGSTAGTTDESSLPVDETTEINRKPTLSSHMSSMSPSFERSARDVVSYAALESSAGTELERMCTKAIPIRTLTFPPDSVVPSANELATLVYITSAHEPTYNVTNTQCYWFVETIFEAIKSLFAGAEEIIVNAQGGTWNGVRIRRKPSADGVSTKYRAARAALAEEAERKHTAQRQQDEETRRERQAVEGRALEAEERALEAEERALEAAERALEAAERALAAEEANARLLQELEALRRARASTSQD